MQFSWRANTNTARDVTDYYEIYNGDDLTSLQSIEGKNALAPIAAGQLHTADNVLMSYIDDTPVLAAKGFGETMWYSVPAVHVSPLGPIKSDFATR